MDGYGNEVQTLSCVGKRGGRAVRKKNVLTSSDSLQEIQNALFLGSRHTFTIILMLILENRF